MSYTISTPISTQQTIRELGQTFRMWGVTDWDIHYTAKESKVSLWYMKNGRRVTLEMDTQKSSKDNLRVLYLAIDAMRLNDKRGIGEVVAQAYKQLEAPEGEIVVTDPYQLLGIREDTDLETAEAMYKIKSKKAHPDGGGNARDFEKLTKAIEIIREQRKE